MPEFSIAGPSIGVNGDGSFPDDSPLFKHSENVVRLTGNVDQVVAFQCVLSAQRGQVNGLELLAEDLVGATGTIGREVVRMYRQWPISVERYPNWYLRSLGRRRPREILDILVPITAPRHGQPFVITAKDSLPLWVEIRIPPDARPGTYQTAVVMRDAEGHTSRIPVEVEVRDLCLSPRDAIAVLARVQLAPVVAELTRLDPLNLKLALADDAARHVLTRVFSLLHEHGVSPYTDEIYPLFSQDQDGAVRPDWTDYDAFCGPLIDGSAYKEDRPALAWPIPADLRQPDPALFGGIQSAVYSAVLRDYLIRIRDHFKEKGWLDRSFVHFDLPQHPNPSAEDLDQVRQLAAITHSVRGDWAFASKLIPQPLSPFGWFEHRFEDLSADIDIWATSARYQHPPTLARLRTLGKQAWLVPDRPPYSGSVAVEAPPIQARSLPWQAFLQGHDAILIHYTTDWPDDVVETPIRDRDQPSDRWLLYPGTPFGLDEPVPSVRLKQLQLGMQDFQLLRLLDRQGRGATARLLAGSLIKACGTDAYGDNYQDGLYGRRIEDAAVWESARRILIDEAVGTMAGDQDVGSNPGALKAAWAKFLSATRHIEVWVESARLTVDDRLGQAGYLIKYGIAARNELRTPLTGELSFGSLPAEMRSVSDIVRLGPIPEMGLVRECLVAASPTLPTTDLDGHHIQEIVLDAGASGYVKARATLSVVQVQQAPSRITIDGDLSDWPPNELNIIGDFRLISANAGGRSSARTDGSPLRDRARALSQTVAYFCHRDGILYIAVHAASPKDQDDVAVRPLRNFVSYEDLMPMDEDLVEILIDPTNAGTQSDDLYHIVLKSTGNPIFERGVGVVPPIGKRLPWPTDPPACCVVPTADGWCAEVAIPIDTFGAEAADNLIWGVNLARLEPIRGEYSDWARAPRYCYDPRTLGNLVWP